MGKAAEILNRIPERTTREVSVVCFTVSPFTVLIDGSSTPVRARVQAGSTFSSGDAGRASWTPPSLPTCFKTS